ncbi:hypothetical protein GIB67_026659 [Kingdonia uniflora]|uniref:Helicase C-terminal domain-containing protein n=1 Tax=Kingdonia uniflora TaxID=39325 RepID=A0A7J7MGG2_9MAGN|nr:hypothetical protein GIB67_026659 [Kingdonia uniflora]
METQIFNKSDFKGVGKAKSTGGFRRDIGKKNSPVTPNSESKQKQQPNLVQICVHEVVVPAGYVSSKVEYVHGTLSNPVFNGTEAKSYPFNLDPFQQVFVRCLKRNKSVLVSAHTSAGKTVVVEYAIAMAFRDKKHVFNTSPFKALSSQKYRELAQEFSDVGLMTGGSGLYLVVDENEQFKEDNFVKVQDTFAKLKKQGDGNKSQNANSSGGIAKNGTSSGGSDLYKIVKIFVVVVACWSTIYSSRCPLCDTYSLVSCNYSFSRRECEQHAMSISKLDFNAKNEKDVVKQIDENAILSLNEEDRNLPAIELMFSLLQRSIAVHYSGLLPIIKEVVELLFQEGLVKALFSTKTFLMGLNMPAKTVVFTSVRKWDGNGHRIIGSSEYIQMSDRAGHRGKDERGIFIIMIDDQMEMNTLKDMVLGKPAPLISTFRLSYYTILNLMSHAEGKFTAEHVIRNSFHQFQYEKALPDIGERVSKLEKEAAILDASREVSLA